MSLSKKYLKTKPVCKVTFKLPSELASEANTVVLAGDFNNWDINANPMKKLKKDGSFSLTLDLETGREYKYRYFVDNNQWINDNEADSYQFDQVVNTDNCIVKV